ncbi:hypothetical protein SAMN05421796_101411 [Chryseobacterium piscicola]|uniref:Uncharacterized protein n=1 Tax=Chryseobacterium piscicola TaxID=551459 RepID=A0A1N7KA19_9FLAO|nr:hypothetical protein SAMN05421796_101411 [Chryseobacterium piscicola]
MTIISIEELNDIYKKTPRWKRIMFFILALIIIILQCYTFFYDNN